MSSVARSRRASSLLDNSLHSALPAGLIVNVGLVLAVTGNEGIDLTRPVATCPRLTSLGRRSYARTVLMRAIAGDLLGVDLLHTL